jgi:hypothetical protein
MFTLMIALAVLSVLYGFVWHDEPPREPAAARTADRTHQPHG